MTVHSFHLARMSPVRTVGALIRSPAQKNVPGLRHFEVLAGMELGAPVFSLRRMQVHRLAAFAEWADEAALEDFLAEDFHHEFTTLRFRPLSEHGTWEGQTGLVPTSAA